MNDLPFIDSHIKHLKFDFLLVKAVQLSREI